MFSKEEIQAVGTIYYGTDLQYLKSLDHDGLMKPRHRLEEYISVCVSAYTSSLLMAHDDLFEMARVFESMGLCQTRENKIFFKPGYENSLTYIQGFGPNPSDYLHGYYGLLENMKKSKLTAVISKEYVTKLVEPSPEHDFEYMSLALHGYIEYIKPEMIMAWIVDDQNYNSVKVMMTSGEIKTRPIFKSSDFKQQTFDLDRFVIYGSDYKNIGLYLKDIHVASPHQKTKIKHLKHILSCMTIDWSSEDLETHILSCLKDKHLIWDQEKLMYSESR